MRSQTFQYAVSVGLLVAGLMIGFQAGKGIASDKLVGTSASHVMAATTLAPSDYFPAQYANQAKSVEPLPEQF
jgi:hypothetical protein